MNEQSNKNAKLRIWRRIVVKSIVFAVWAVGALMIVLQGGQELPQNTYPYLLFVIVAVWAVSAVRDARRLRQVSSRD